MQHNVGEQVYEALRRPGRRLCPCQTSIYRVRRKGYRPIVIVIVIVNVNVNAIVIFISVICIVFFLVVIIDNIPCQTSIYGEEGI